MAPIFDALRNQRSVTAASLALLVQPAAAQNYLIDPVIRTAVASAQMQLAHEPKVHRAKLVLRQSGQSQFHLAGHRSHQSHRSHSSHRSHYSSQGGYSAPTYSPPENRYSVAEAQSTESRPLTPARKRRLEREQGRRQRAAEAALEQEIVKPKPLDRSKKAANRLQLAHALTRPEARAKKLKEISEEFPETSAAQDARKELGVPEDLLGFRIWKDASEKHQIDARFIAYGDGTVQLLKRDDKTIAVTLERLSKSDQEIVRRINQTIRDAPLE